MPTLAVRELVYCTDEKALYIGTSAGNIKLCAAALEGVVNTHTSSINSLNNNVSSLGNALTAVSNTASGNFSSIQNIMNTLPSKLTAGKVAAQAGLAADADAATIVTAVNNLIAAMKASGVMKN